MTDNTQTPIVLVDVETTGVDDTDEIWEFAAIRRAPGRPDTEAQFFVEHDTSLAERLPESFRADHAARYDPIAALSQDLAADFIRVLTRSSGDGQRALLVGACPWFDAGKLTALLARFDIQPAWSHRLICVESLTAGHLGRWVGGLSNCAEALGIPHTDAHTAMGDVNTTAAIFDHIMRDSGGEQ